MKLYDNKNRVPHDPYSAFLFSVHIDGGDKVGGFNEVSGLTFEIEVQTLRFGGMNAFEHQLPGPSKFPSRLVLKRGLGDIDFLWKWYQQIATGKIVRRGIHIKLNNEQGIERTSWNFKEACPVKWVGPELRANNSAIAFEAIELVHRGLAET
ncbi:phage tail protein [Nitrosospira sp. Is2]|uniref:phage tail protein n=1 Tax=Nitrosospira sp. Is2 TaxID=3080532 RepID=UPI00295556D7|nr:phage tail protein [Nitrosospira sp. Is2]WON73512.1 phage tail protein [Nitrosospira sp. Is2]